METGRLKKFAQYARRTLIEQVSARLKAVLAENSTARREQRKVVTDLEKLIRSSSQSRVVDQVAYTWFNRFCALRFMDVNRYNRVSIVSPLPGQFQPEILAEAKAGHIDEELMPEEVRQSVFALLNGSAPSSDPQGEAYRKLIVAACNQWHKSMPFLFQRINDYTELLMPDDLLSGNSILAYTREAMTPDTCEDVEVIGWLYQFYISEKKDEVFDGLKKNKKITPENIPAATQLFTPHWIVRYLVENSLGRLWLLNRPGSKLAEKMDYYIKPEQPETDYLRIGKPEEIKICDPACGSGHMLTYAFDLLYAIYEEEGYEPAVIPEKILSYNLFGIEIDERAGELAAFALTMKALQYDKRFFRRASARKAHAGTEDAARVEPNICVLQNVKFETILQSNDLFAQKHAGEDELKAYMDFVGRDLFTTPLQTTLRQFEEADNFGSLIRPDVTDVNSMLKLLETKNVSGQLFINTTHQKVLQALRQADYLSPKYHVVIANPPYMNSGGMNGRLKVWSSDAYPSSKADLFSMFMDRNNDLAMKHGLVAMITMQSWMFLSSFEKLRMKMLSESIILTMAHLGERGFDTIGGVVVSTTAFVFMTSNNPTHRGDYLRLIEGVSEIEKSAMAIEAIGNHRCGWFYNASTDNFYKLPEAPIAYWLSENVREAFRFPKIGDVFEVKEGLGTRDDPRFLRSFWEVEHSKIRFNPNGKEKWVPTDKAGGFRKWFGSNETLMNWEDDGYEIKRFEKSVPRNTHYFFKPAVSWGKVATGRPSFRLRTDQFAFVDAAPSAFGEDLHRLLSSLNSCAIGCLLKIQGSTVNVTVGTAKNLPYNKEINETSSEKCVHLAKKDWDSYETSWDFTGLPLLTSVNRQPNLQATYQKLRSQWREMTLEMQRLEEENNRIFIDAYGLNDELDKKVALNEITLTCNPYYRYDNDKSEDELEALLQADTMRELISYAVGCMFGRYALDKPGLILANQGETIEDYLKRVPNPCLPADEDNVIPMLDGDWFADDITERFRKLLRVAFGEEHYEENLTFIEQALGKDIQKYFLKDFYADHVKRYKKRPIYWLFSSPKGSFNALIYMHRYRPDTVSVVLNDYLREFRTKLAAKLDHLREVERSTDAGKGEKARALKEIEKLQQMIAELDAYERDTLYPLAAKKIEIDLDDGVKANYQKFGAALKKIPGLDATED